MEVSSLRFNRAKYREYQWKDKIWLKFLEKFSFFAVSGFFLKLFLLTFSLPIGSQIFQILNFFSGFYNPFLNFTLYLSEIFLILSLLFAGLSFFDQRFFYKETSLFFFPSRNITLCLLLFSFFLFAQIFYSSTPLLAFFISLRYLELLGLYFLLSSNLLDFKTIFRFLSLGLFFQVLLAFGQYFKQGSIGLSFIGEPQLSPITLGIAKIQTSIEPLKSSITFIRPYGTFPHPNVLGGTLFLMISLYLIRYKNRFLKGLPLLLIFMSGLLLTFSRSAFLALFIFTVVFFLINKIKVNKKYLLVFLSLLIFFVFALNLVQILKQRLFTLNDEAIQERIFYMDISQKMIDSSLLGKGLGSFTWFMQDFASEKLLPWQYQPVHNVFLLVFTEIGMIGLFLYLLVYGAVFFNLFSFVSQKNASNHQDEAKIFLALGLGLICLSFFDHYLFTLFPGLTIFYLYLGITQKLNNC